MDDFQIKIDEEKPSLATRARLGLPSILMIVFVFAMSGIGSLIQIDFAFKEVVWVSFLGIIGLRIAVYFCSRWVGGATRYQRDESSAEVETAAEEFRKEMDGVDIAAFAEWADRENQAEKERVYRDQCNALILSLQRRIVERKSKPKLRKRDVRFIERTQRQIEDARARCTDEFIAETLSFIKVHYDHINPVDFMSQGHSAHSRQKYSYDASREISLDVVKSVPLVILTSLAGSLVTMSTIVGSINIASVVYDLMSATMNFATGWVFIGAKNTQKHISVLNNKRAVLLKFKRSRG